MRGKLFHQICKTWEKMSHVALFNLLTDEWLVNCCASGLCPFWCKIIFPQISATSSGVQKKKLIVVPHKFGVETNSICELGWRGGCESEPSVNQETNMGEGSRSQMTGWPWNSHSVALRWTSAQHGHSKVWISSAGFITRIPSDSSRTQCRPLRWNSNFFYIFLICLRLFVIKIPKWRLCLQFNGPLHYCDCCHRDIWIHLPSK